jgi:NAD(P)-dependent dehydrogenase (short-subunit alcohol dehydrogenase family)
VALVDNDCEKGAATAQELAEHGPVSFMPCDVSQSLEVERAVAASLDSYGRINVLVNNAALLGPGDLLASSDDDLAKVLAVDLFGPLCLSKHVLPHMTKQGGGVIVNIASIACFVGSPNYPAYAASKAGLVGLTRSLARKYARRNVRINCLCPGSVRGTNLRTRSALRKYSTQEELALIGRIPLGRTVYPHEVAEMVFFLASPAAAAMTGATIVLDGGEMLGL